LGSESPRIKASLRILDSCRKQESLRRPAAVCRDFVCAHISPVTIAEAAARLGMTPKQIRYQITLGMPTVRRGRRGRGGSTLLDPAALLAWMNAGASPSEIEHRKLAHSLIRAVADSHVILFRTQSGPHKIALAANIVAGFIATANAVLLQLGLPSLKTNEMPESIRQIAKLLSL
jgi:hypothetical protein